MHIRILVFAVVLLTSVNGALAQYLEIGYNAGGMTYQGDLSQKQITINASKPALGLAFRYPISNVFLFRANLNNGWISGDDKNYPESRERIKRNLSFNSQIIELNPQVELLLAKLLRQMSYRYRISHNPYNRFNPYVSAGFSLFYFNPKTTYLGNTYSLRLLQTEADKPEYSLIQPAITYGLGFKYALPNDWTISLEVGLRKTFTDYLDDVSGKYPNYDALVASGRPVDAALSDRAREVAAIYGEESWLNQKSQEANRGDPSDKDSYIWVGFTVTRQFTHLPRYRWRFF